MVISVPIILALVLGVGIGLVAGYLTFPAIREAKRLRVQLDGLVEEHETYRKSVSAHFRKTGELVGEMTRSYAAVYDHLAGGARSFAAEAASEMTLSFGPSPGILAPPAIDASTEGSPPSADMDADTPLESDAALGSDAALESDAAVDGSMLAAEVYVGNEGALDSSSETTNAVDASPASSEHHKA